MMLIPCILICFVFGYGVCSELNGTSVIHRESGEHGIFHCIPRICPKNSHAILCTATDPANPGKDECMPCEKNTINPWETNTSTFKSHTQVSVYEVCRKPVCYCVSEAIISNPDDCLKTGIAKCECNLTGGYCGEDPNTCRKWEGNVTDLGKGVGLTQSCQVKKCDPGYFKDKVGYGQCLKHRECSIEEKIIFNGNSTMNRQCGPLTQTMTPTESTKMFDANSTVGTSSAPTSPSSDDPDQILVIIGSVVGSIILLGVPLVIAFIYWRKRERNVANPGDEEHNGDRPLQSGDEEIELQLQQNGRQENGPLMQNGETGILR